MKYKTFYPILLASLTASCAMQPAEPTITVANGVRIFTTSAEQQSTFMKDHGSSERFCLARGADVADSESTGIGASFGVADKSEDLTENSSMGAVSLGGRNSAVLISRELMYRTCEIIMNLNLSQEEALKLYAKALEATITVSKNQQDSSAATSNTTTNNTNSTETNNSSTVEDAGVD
jgi:hypothetical protein